MLSKAESLDQIYQAFKGRPLKIEELSTFYCNPVRARGGGDVRRRIARIFRNTPDSYEHILFVGYKGCGKSTELNHLQKDIEDDFLTINFSVQSELDPVHLNYIELFIVTMERLFQVANENKLQISDEYLKSVQHWYQTKEVEEIRDQYVDGSAEVGVSGEYGVPFFASFFSKLKATAKSSRSLKETLKRNIEPKLSELIEHCNNLIREIRFDLGKIEKKDLLIIIEDLDKIPLDRAEQLFFNYTNQLVQLQSNVVFTFPIALYHSIRFNDIKAYFTNTYELPMIKVVEKNGQTAEIGIAIMQEIVEARMNTNALFRDENILKKMITLSGGCIRDLFLLIQEAADSALDLNKEIIEEEDFKLAFQKLKKEYDNTIADNFVNDELIPVENYYEALVKLYESNTKKADNTLEVMHLRQNLCILGYNGEGWCDVHPIVQAILKEREKIT